MGEDFFTEVTGPIPFGGLGLDRPALVQGLRARPARPRQADGGPPPARASASGTRSPGRASTCSASARSTGRGSARPAMRWPPRGRRWPSPSSSSRSSASPTTASTIATSRPRADVLRRVPREPRRARRRGRAATRRGPASACCGARPTCSAIRATRPAPRPTRTPRSSPTPRRRSSTCSRSRKRLGGENYVLWGGREGYDTLLNTDLAPRGRPARPLPAPRRRAQAQDRVRRASCSSSPSRWSRPSTSTTTTRATVHGFLVRHGLEGEYRVNIEANHATLAGHSFHHEVAYAIANGMLRQHRREPRRPPERLGHRPVPELGRRPRAAALRDPARRRPRAPAASTSTPSCVARASTGPTCSMPTSARIDTLARALLVAADLVERGELAGTARRALRRLGRPARPAILGGSESRSSRSRPKVAAGEIDPRPRVRAARSCSRTSSTSSIWAADPARAKAGAGR